MVVCYSLAGCRVVDHRFAAVDHMHLAGLELVDFRSCHSLAVDQAAVRKDKVDCFLEDKATEQRVDRADSSLRKDVLTIGR